MKKFLLLGVFVGAGLAAAGARADGSRFIPVFDMDLRGGFDKLNRGPFSGAAIGTVLALPAYKVSASGILLPIYAFDGSVNDKNVEVAETGGVLFVQHQVHAGSLGYKQGLGDAVDAKVSFDSAYALNRETPSETVGKGLYDYYDLGGRAVLTWKRSDADGPAPLTGSLKVYERTYPNFMSLAQKNKATLEQTDPAAAAAIGDKEQHPKDYLGVEAGVNQLVQLLGGRVQAGYTAAVKMYGDSYLRSDQGLLLGSDKRQDLLHRVVLGWSGGLPGGWSYGAQLDARFNQSNNTYYEVNQKLHPFTPHFNQFGSAQLGPWSEWALGGGSGPHPRIRITELSMIRWYTDRFKQDGQGMYVSGKQLEFEHILSVQAWFPLARRLGASVGVDGGIDRANNHFEQFIRYNYETLVMSAGLTLSF